MLHKRPRRTLSLLCLAAASLGSLCLTSCGGDDTNTLTVYNGQHPALTQELANEFQSETGIKVNIRSDDSIIIAQELLAEDESTPADVYIAENSPELMVLQQHGAFATLPAATLANIPARFNSPTGAWVGMAARVSCLVYNPSRIAASDLPASVLDLAESTWAGKVGVSPGDSDFVPIVSAVLASKGESATTAWLQGLKTNAHTYQDIEAVMAAVNRGDEAVGIINSYYYFRLQLEVGTSGVHSRLYYFPGQDPGGVENIAGAAVLKHGPHQANAKKFVDFMVSQKGQEILAKGDDFEYPLRAGVQARKELPPIGTINPTFLGIAKLGDDQQASHLLQRAGLS